MTAINILKLDYEGPRKESVVALGLVFLFAVLLTGAAFAGHSGADREALCLVTTSLGLMVVAIILWIGLGIVSMQKSDPNVIWQVCLENRCTETFWTLDFSYRNATSLSKETLQRMKERRRPSLETKFDDTVQMGRVLPLNGTRHDLWRDDFDGQEVEERREGEGERRYTEKDDQISFWSRMIGGGGAGGGGVGGGLEPHRNQQPAERKGGGPLLLTLVCFLIGFVYFFVCVTIVCSYSAELYEEYSSEEVEDEGSVSGKSLLTKI